MSVCPKCSTTNVLVGNFPLSCNACGWNYLNAYPCRACGGPSVAAMGNGREPMYACRDHPFTAEETTRAWRRFAEAVTGKVGS